MPVLGGKVNDIAARRSAHPGRIPEQDHAQAWLSVCEHELPEVLVFGQQNPTIAHGKRSNFVVRRLRVRIGDRANVVSGSPRCTDHRVVAALVGQESHLLSGMIHAYSLVVGERLGGETHGSTQILPRDARIGVKEVVLRRAFAQLSQEEFNGNTRTPDNRFP